MLKKSFHAYGAVDIGVLSKAINALSLLLRRARDIWPVVASAMFLACCQPLPDVPHALPPAAPSTPEYRLQVGDQFDVRFFDNPELNESVSVQPDGRFSLALVQNMQAAGRTTEEVAAALTAAYRAELIRPKISVILRSALPARIYVGGEVNSPGEYLSVGPPLTLVQAIARAGGLKNSANPDQVILVRRNGKGPPDLYSLSFNGATTGADPKQDIALMPYDSLFVPRTVIANIYLAYQQYIQQFIPASVSYSYGTTVAAP